MAFKDTKKNHQPFKPTPTDKNRRLDVMRIQTDRKYRQVYTSSNEGVKSGNESGELTPVSESHGVDINISWDDLKQKVQSNRNRVSEMVFGPHSASEVKVVLSEYGQRLLSDRKMRESSEIMLELLGNDQTALGKAIKDSEDNNSTGEDDTASKKFLMTIGEFRSQLSEGKIDRAKVTYEQINEQVKQHMITQADPVDFGILLQKGKDTRVQVRNDYDIPERRYIIDWLDLNHQVQKQLSQKDTANQDSKVYADDPEAATKYFEHLLAKSGKLDMTAFVTKLDELHEHIVKEIDEHMKHSAVIDVDLSDYLKTASVGIGTVAKDAYGSSNGMKSNESKMQRNEKVWKYIVNIQNLLRLENKLQQYRIEAKHQAEQLGAMSDNEDGIRVEKLDKSIQVSEITHVSGIGSWPPPDAHEIEKWYPKNIRLHDVWSVLHNEGRQKIDGTLHKHRLDAIALRATEWTIRHGWNIPSNDAKEDLHKKVQDLFNENDPKAGKLFECIIRQDRKDKQLWINRARIYLFTRSKLQAAKKEVIENFDACSARDSHINRKSAQFQDISWKRKIFKRGGGFWYGQAHEKEMKHLNKELQSRNDIEQKIKMCRQERDSVIKGFERETYEWSTKFKNAETPEEKQNMLIDLQNIATRAIHKQLAYINANIKESSVRNEAAQQKLTEELKHALAHASHGIWAEVGLHVLDMAMSVGALGIALHSAGVL
jgi:hypothetical protein